MKVLCIDAKPRLTTVNNEPRLTEGGTYTVRKEVEGEDEYGYDVHNCYELVGFSSDYCFEADRFVPTSDIDEKEMIKERNLLTQTT